MKRECLPQHRHEGKVGHTAEEGARGVHARRPRRQSVEHVACVAVPDLESIFGIFRAHSDLDASSKVALLWILYKFD